MRVFAVLDETPFYHPEFFADVLRKSKDEFVGVAIVRKIPKSNNVNTYLMKNWRCLHFREMAVLAMRKARMQFLDRTLTPGLSGPFYSVQKVCEVFAIPFFHVDMDINSAPVIEKIREHEIDVLLSSNSLIFKSELLSLPKVTCLNRHSSLLPSYGGVWPVLRGVMNGEREFGVSVHTMEEKVDAGKVLSQLSFTPEVSCSVADIYERCFELSAEAVLQALDKVRDNDFTHVSQTLPSYFSFPKAKDWEMFRRRGGRFV